MAFEKEIQRRRTFAIISHPDAGKTTLTEKLLLFGGAIHVAGAVKSNKIDAPIFEEFPLVMECKVDNFDEEGLLKWIEDTKERYKGKTTHGAFAPFAAYKSDFEEIDDVFHLRVQFLDVVVGGESEDIIA